MTIKLLLALCLTVSVGAFESRTSSGAIGQAKPDFSGAWTFDHTTTLAARGFGIDSEIGFGFDFTVGQDERTLTLKVLRKSWKFSPYTLVYALDGSESKNKMPASTVGKPDWDTTARVSWEPGKLVIDTDLQNLIGGTVNYLHSRAVLQMQADGMLLVHMNNTAWSDNRGKAAAESEAMDYFYKQKS